ncbi:MAG: caspase family protein [Planctomycetota bacterium]
MMTRTIGCRLPTPLALILLPCLVCLNVLWGDAGAWASEPPTTARPVEGTRALSLETSSASQESLIPQKSVGSDLLQQADQIEQRLKRQTRSFRDAHPQRSRHALVIGNADYGQRKLRNPINDVRAVDQALTSMGFVVTRLEDADLEQMDDAITKFARELPADSLAFLFYAGHGVQVEMQNYLIPVGARISEAAKVPHRTLSLDMVLDLLGDSRSAARCVILDCCRDNPFTRQWTLERGEVRRGLASLRGSRDNMMIAYSTAAGKTASDGSGNHSPYVKHFLDVIREPSPDGLYLRELLKRTAQRVKRDINQSPWSSRDESMSDICLISPASASASEVAISISPSQPPPIISAETQREDAQKTIEVSLCRDLLNQARLYESNREYQDAIATYTTVLSLDRATAFDKRSARIGRSTACLARGNVDDIKMALTDTLAAGERGMLVSIRASQADLMDGATKVATLHRGQVIEVRSIQGKWISVHAVGKDRNRRGHVSLSSVAEPVNATVDPALSVPSSVANATGNAMQPGTTTGSGTAVRPDTLTQSTSASASGNRVTSQSYTPAQPQRIESSISASRITPSAYPNASRSGGLSWSSGSQPSTSQTNRGFQTSQGYNSSQRYQPQRSTQSSSHRSSSTQRSSSSGVYNMTLAESQKLIDANNRAKWQPGADHRALERDNQRIRAERQRRWNDYFSGRLQAK